MKTQKENASLYKVCFFVIRGELADSRLSTDFPIASNLNKSTFCINLKKAAQMQTLLNLLITLTIFCSSVQGLAVNHEYTYYGCPRGIDQNYECFSLKKRLSGGKISRTLYIFTFFDDSPFGIKSCYRRSAEGGICLAVDNAIWTFTNDLSMENIEIFDEHKNLKLKMNAYVNFIGVHVYDSQ